MLDLAIDAMNFCQRKGIEFRRYPANASLFQFKKDILDIIVNDDGKIVDVQHYSDVKLNNIYSLGVSTSPRFPIIQITKKKNDPKSQITNSFREYNSLVSEILKIQTRDQDRLFVQKLFSAMMKMDIEFVGNIILKKISELDTNPKEVSIHFKLQSYPDCIHNKAVNKAFMDMVCEIEDSHSDGNFIDIFGNSGVRNSKFKGASAVKGLKVFSCNEKRFLKIYGKDGDLGIELSSTTKNIMDQSIDHIFSKDMIGKVSERFGLDEFLAVLPSDCQIDEEENEMMNIFIGKGKFSKTAESKSIIDEFNKILKRGLHSEWTSNKIPSVKIYSFKVSPNGGSYTQNKKLETNVEEFIRFCLLFDEEANGSKEHKPFYPSYILSLLQEHFSSIDQIKFRNLILDLVFEKLDAIQLRNLLQMLLIIWNRVRSDELGQKSVKEMKVPNWQRTYLEKSTNVVISKLKKKGIKMDHRAQLLGKLLKTADELHSCYKENNRIQGSLCHGMMLYDLANNNPNQALVELSRRMKVCVSWAYNFRKNENANKKEIKAMGILKRYQQTWAEINEQGGAIPNNWTLEEKVSLAIGFNSYEEKISSENKEASVSDTPNCLPSEITVST